VPSRRAALLARWTTAQGRPVAGSTGRVSERGLLRLILGHAKPRPHYRLPVAAASAWTSNARTAQGCRRTHRPSPFRRRRG
jgi:hypothetical protein